MDTKTLTLAQVLAFCHTANLEERRAIMRALTEAKLDERREILRSISPGDTVEFTYDSVHYTAMVDRINRSTATVKLLEIDGRPRRRIRVNDVLRVSAGLLKHASNYEFKPEGALA